MTPDDFRRLDDHDGQVILFERVRQLQEALARQDQVIASMNASLDELVRRQVADSAVRGLLGKGWDKALALAALVIALFSFLHAVHVW